MLFAACKSVPLKGFHRSWAILTESSLYQNFSITNVFQRIIISASNYANNENTQEQEECSGEISIMFKL